MSLHLDLAALARGDDEPWRQFLEKYARLILLAAHRVGLEEHDREDVLQIVSIRVLHQISRLRNPDSLDSWLYRVAFRASVDILRSRSRETTLGTLEPMVEEPEIEQALDEAGRLERLSDSLGHLDERCRRLLTALYLRVPRPSYETIGEEFGLAIGSIGPIRARCLRRLRRIVDGAVS